MRNKWEKWQPLIHRHIQSTTVAREIGGMEKQNLSMRLGSEVYTVTILTSYFVPPKNLTHQHL